MGQQTAFSTGHDDRIFVLSCEPACADLRQSGEYWYGFSLYMPGGDWICTGHAQKGQLDVPVH